MLPFWDKWSLKISTSESSVSPQKKGFKVSEFYFKEFLNETICCQDK